MKDAPEKRLGNGSPLLLTVVGARPQFIKSAGLTRALQGSDWHQWLLHAGQHADDDMGLDFLSELGVPMPDARVRPAQSGRSQRLADMMLGVTHEIQRVQPTAVLVYGDTDATLAGALAAHHAKVPLVHVEAGLRSGDREMPEEHNRLLTDQLSDVLCTTGPGATAQLRKEDVAADRIVEVGDVMLDVALAAKERVQERYPMMWPQEGSPVLTVTMHRPATVDSREKLQGALVALDLWSQQTGGCVYFPIHPRTRKNIERFNLTMPESIIDPGPLSYLDMQAALYHAHGVLTDSGGLQKEAWFQGTQAVILRNTTEWRELLELGVSELFDPEQLNTPAGSAALVDRLTHRRDIPSVEGSGLFGEGLASRRILEALSRFLK